MLVECRDVTVYFGGLPALKDVNIAVNEGEIRAVIGPNGAGKTTLFNVINGVIKPSSGRVFLLGTDVTGKPPPRDSPARYFENPADTETVQRVDSFRERLCRNVVRCKK
jgi:ABC-type branched-subunit amino acid transport system ATPase component